MSTCKITRIALNGAILFVSQVALAGIPNCEMVSLLIVVMAMVYGREMLLTVTLFSTLEVMMYGLGIWVIMYFYTWPILVLSVLLLKPLVKDCFSVWAVVSGMFGLLFGTFCSLFYVPIDISFAISYWISGLPWDVWHAVTNFTLMIVLGRVLYVSLKRVENLVGRSS